MKKQLNLTILFLFTITNLFAQNFNLSGVIRDSFTHEVIENVNITIDYKKKIMGAISKSDGSFKLNIPNGEHILTARKIGYVSFSKSIMINEIGLVLDFNLDPLEQQLEQIVISSKGFDQSVKRPILGVNEINIKTLAKLPSALGEVDVLRGLQMMPGVSSVGEASNGVNIRGGTTDQTLMLFDGTPIFNPTHMFGLFSVFSPDAINSLDLYKGNIPARFSGRTASVLDISTKVPNLEHLNLAGGVGFVSDRFSLDGPLIKDKLGILIAARGAFNDFALPVISSQLNGIKAKFGDITSKIFWKVNSKNTVTAMAYYSFDIFSTALLANLPNVNGSSTKYYNKINNGMFKWSNIINSKLDWQTSLIYANNSPTLSSQEINSTNIVSLNSNLNQTEFKSNINYQLNNIKSEFGCDFKKYKISPGTLNPGQSHSVNYIKTPDENGNELGAYLDEEIKISKVFSFSAGLRYSKFNALGPYTQKVYAIGQELTSSNVIDSIKFSKGQIIKTYGGFEPRLGLRIALSESSSLKFGFNRMRQYLQEITNTTTPLPTSRWITANTSINPQISNLISAGYFHNFKSNIYELSIETYYRNTTNVIDYKPGADFLLQAYPETQLLQGRNISYGVESMISKKKGKTTGWLNYTYARSFNLINEGTNLTQSVNGGNWYRANYDRPHILNASVNFEVDKHNNFGFIFNFSSGRPYTAPTGFVTSEGAIYPVFTNRNNLSMPAYHRLDFNWNIYNPTMKTKRWEGQWTFTVYNLYARKNDYSIYFKMVNGIITPFALQIFAAPILALTYNFKFK